MRIIRLSLALALIATPALAEDSIYSTSNNTSSVYNTTNISGGTVYTTSGAVPVIDTYHNKYNLGSTADRQRLRDERRLREAQQHRELRDPDYSDRRDWRRDHDWKDRANWRGRDRDFSDRAPRVTRIPNVGRNGYDFNQGRYYSVTAARAAYGAPLYRGD